MLPAAGPRASHNMKCPDTLVLCGHGDYGQDANNRIRKAAELARAAGEFPDYLIYGNSTYAKHRRKHNFLIGDVPAFAYTFCNVAHSKTRRAVFIGNEDSRQIFDACRTFFAPLLQDRLFLFLEERGEFAANVMLGRDALHGGEAGDRVERHTLLLNGDLPFLFALDVPLTDPDLEDFDMIFDANSRELQGSFLPRHYRLRLRYKSPDPASRGEPREFHVKEPNYFLFDLDFLTEGVLDKVYGSRRIHDSVHGWQDLVLNTYIRKFRWLETVSILIQNHAAENLLSWAGGSRDRLIFEARQAEQLADYGLRKVLGKKTRCRVKVTNEDPGAVKDLDSFGTGAT